MANLMQLEIVTPDKYFIKRDDVVYAGFEATPRLNTGTLIMKNISFIYPVALLKL